MNILQKFELMLRISPDTPAEYLIRYRAIWILGMLFVAMELLNLVTMSFTYGNWTYDHSIALSTSATVMALIILLRWYKQYYHVYAFIYSSLVLGGTAASALPEHAGINTALLPLLTLGPLVTGYISGRVATILFWIFGSLFLAFLYWVSINNPPLMINGTYMIETNRLSNAFYFLTISAALSTMLTEQTFSAMTKMRENELRARKAEAAKTEFLAKMSHELRTPLNGVIGLTDALLMRDLPEREEELAKTIRQSGQSLLMILNDLLDLSKIEAGKMAVQPAPTHIYATIDMAVQGWREAAKNRGLAFEVIMSDDLHRGAMMDGLRLRQILHNLISNAIKFTDEGKVSVLADVHQGEDGEEQLFILVRDTGCGVSEDARDRIFESFEQDERTGDRRFGGTGLGLPICRMLSELMGGEVWLEETSDAGTTFCVRLPFIPADLPEASQTDRGRLEPQNALKVLVAEDHKVNRLVLAEFLSILGMRYEFAEDGVECLARLKADKFDVILMDKNMPRLNGIEATKIIRESDEAWSQIPIIALTADAMVGEKERLLEIGMDGFLSKPLEISDLARVFADLTTGKASSSGDADGSDNEIELSVSL